MTDGLDRLAELVSRETGIVIKEPQLPALEAALQRAAPGIDPSRFVASVSSSGLPDPLLERLIDEVTVKETYFFRAPRELRAIDWQAALSSARCRGSDVVRVWVAACATGEEAYTLAILAADALGAPTPPVSVLATDVSSGALERAQAGRYSGRALRGLPEGSRERHFVADGGRHRVAEPIRSLVRFRRHNLVADPIPPLGEIPFDVIACRNVLIYFEPATVDRVVDRLERALQPAGTLVLGAADRVTAMRVGDHMRPKPASEGRRRAPPPSSPDPTPAASPPSGARIEQALLAADAGDLEATLEIMGGLLAEDPLDADAHFVRGLAELGLSDPDAAASSFRRASYVDPSFGLAAFELGRAHDARGDGAAARRAYEQALRTLDPRDDRHRAILDDVAVADVAAACRARIRALAAT